MAFNVSDYLNTFEPPTLIVKNDAGEETVYKGRFVTFNEIAPYVERLKDTDKLTNEDLANTIPEVVKALGFDEAVIPVLQQLPAIGQLEALLDFFTCALYQKRK